MLLLDTTCCSMDSTILLCFDALKNIGKSLTEEEIVCLTCVVKLRQSSEIKKTRSRSLNFTQQHLQHIPLHYHHHYHQYCCQAINSIIWTIILITNKSQL